MIGPPTRSGSPSPTWFHRVMGTSPTTPTRQLLPAKVTRIPKGGGLHLVLLSCCAMLGVIVLILTATYDVIMSPRNADKSAKLRHLQAQRQGDLIDGSTSERRNSFVDRIKRVFDGSPPEPLRNSRDVTGVKNEQNVPVYFGPPAPGTVAYEREVTTTSTMASRYQQPISFTYNRNSGRSYYDQLEEYQKNQRLLAQQNAYAQRPAAQRPIVRPPPAGPTNLPYNEAMRLVENTFNMFRNDPAVSIRGFFSSGTNWMRSLLNKNCPIIPFSKRLPPPFASYNTLDTDGIYGWKHGLFLDQEIKNFGSALQHKLIVIVREAPTWIVSAWKMNAMADYSPNAKIWENSIQKRYARVEEYYNKTSINATVLPPGVFFDSYYHSDIRDKYRIDAANVLLARDKVQKNWLSLLNNPEITNRIAFLRYEDLLADTPAKMSEIVNRLGLACPHVGTQLFDPVRERVKFGISDRSIAPREHHPREEFCAKVDSEVFYREILSNLDREFEARVLGYVYPETLEEYCRGVPKPSFVLPNRLNTQSGVQVGQTAPLTARELSTQDNNQRMNSHA